MSGCPSRLWRVLAVAAGLLLGSLAFARTADARQLGALISPGELHKTHAQLEGIRNCEKCHESGARVSGAFRSASATWRSKKARTFARPSRSPSSISG